jgi:hypothetical protein
MTVRLVDQPGGGEPGVSTEMGSLAAEQEYSAVWHGSLAMQRAIMRALYGRLGDDPDAICSAYVKTERSGGLARLRGAEDMAPLLHARMLWREGTLKGWLRQ